MTIQRIVVATDFSDLAETVIVQALALAKQLQATVTLVHSYEIPVYGFPDGVLIAPADLASRLGTAAQTELDGLARRHEGQGVTIATVLRMGAAWDEINAVASELGADLIVVGTHGRRGLARALLGSTAERLIAPRRCPCSSFTRPSQPDDVGDARTLPGVEPRTSRPAKVPSPFPPLRSRTSKGAGSAASR